MMLLCLIVAAASFAAFGLASDRHRQRLPVRPARATMRLGAWAGVALCFVLAIASHGWVYGPILWPAALMFGAAATFLALNLLPDRRSR